jgi:hypothetical protein
MEKDVHRFFKKGLILSFHGWNRDKDVDMEGLRAWIFDREHPHDLYHYLCKFAFTTYDLNEILQELKDQPMPGDVHKMINSYGSSVSKKMVKEMILFVDDQI